MLSLAATPCLLAKQEAKPYQIAENHVIIRFAEKREEAAAREILPFIAGARDELLKKYPFDLATPVEIRLSTTTYEFCQVTGRPWWQASVYRDRVIYLQPLRVLRERGILENTLRHELMHQLADAISKGHCPIWLSEALAVYHSGEIALLKPARKKAEQVELKWNALEKRLEKMPSRAESERLYFQLYHLGQFFESNFNARQIQALLQTLARTVSFNQACQEVFGINAAELERRWLSHWTDKIMGSNGLRIPGLRQDGFDEASARLAPKSTR